MSDINKVIIIGNLTADPVLRHTQTGTAICQFSVANNYTYKKGNEKQETVSYFTCNAWGKTGETIAEFTKKGTKLAVSGRLNQNRWEDKDGKTQSRVEIQVEEFQFLSKKPENQQQQPEYVPASDWD